MDKNIFRSMSYGVYLVSCMDSKRPTGCIANSAMQITSDPATIAVSINHDNYTNACIKESGFFALNILSEENDPKVIGTFGFQSGKEVNKFDEVPYLMVENVPVYSKAIGYVVMKVIGTMETSTHTVFLGEVREAAVLNHAKPMTYAYYHEVVKGKAPKAAPTYIEEEKVETKEKWVCSCCGYEYEGDIPFEDLPEDYVCPICFQPKSVFEKKE